MIFSTYAVGMRYCTHCKQEHPETAFYRYGGKTSHASDLRTYCKDAQRMKNTTYRRKVCRRVVADPAPLRTA